MPIAETWNAGGAMKFRGLLKIPGKKKKKVASIHNIGDVLSESVWLITV